MASSSDKTVNIDVVINTADSANSIKDIKSSIKELENAALSIGDSGEGFGKLTQKAGELKNKLGDLKETTSALNGSGVEKLTASMGLLKDAFETANPEKISAGFKVMGAAMKAIPIFLIIEGIKFLIENFEKLTESGGLIGKVFGFIKDVIDSVIQAFKDLTDWLGLTNNAIEDNAEKTIEAAKKIGEAQQSRYDDEIKLAKAAGKETFDLEIKKQEAVIESARIQVNALKAVYEANGNLSKEQMKNLEGLVKTIHDAQIEIQAQTLAHNKEVADDTKKKNDEAAKSYKDKHDKINKQLQDSANLQKKLADEAAKQRDENDKKELAATEKLLEKNETLQADSAEKKLALDKKRSDAEIDALFEASNRSQEAYQASVDAKLAVEKKYNDDLKSLKDKEAKDQLDAELKAWDDAAKAQDARDKEDLEKRKKHNAEIIAGINSMAQSITTVLDAISDYNDDKANRAVATNEKSLKTQLDSLNASRDQELSKEGLTADQKDAINKKYEQQQYQLNLEAYNKETAIKKKAFEQDKKFKIATTIISTITGAISAVTGMISSIPGPVGIVLGAIAGAAVTVSGALAVAKIKASQFEAGEPPAAPSVGGSGSGGDSAGQGGSFGPQTFGINSGASGVNTGSTRSAGTNAPVQRVYVTQTDIADQNNRVEVLQSRARIG